MDTRELLIRQWNISRSFLHEVAFPSLTEEMLHWEPSANVIAVRQSSTGVWIADWPTEEQEETAQATGAWLLWHMEWWLGNTVRAVRGSARLPPNAHCWSGSLGASTQKIENLLSEWFEMLSTNKLEQRVTGLMPTDEPFAFVAAWATFELAKNATELNQSARQFTNRTTHPNVAR